MGMGMGMGIAFVASDAFHASPAMPGRGTAIIYDRGGGVSYFGGNMTENFKPKVALARHMRKTQTLPEGLIWTRLKARKDSGLVFRRQHALGPYILDFYCFKAALCVEIDGSAHGSDERSQRDEVRDIWLTAQGLEVYRVPVAEVFRVVFLFGTERLRKRWLGFS